VRWAAALAALIVLAVALSRVYLGVHYPSDVIAGVLLGIGWAVYIAACVGELGQPSRRLHR
jgi:undecaprenyl-diphosphatase